MKLAELFVELTLKGFTAFSQQLENVREKMEKITAGAQAVGSLGAQSFASLKSATEGWVRAGLAGTAQGELLGRQIHFLAREIASVFLPVVDEATSRIRQLTEWFRHLTGEQQANIRYWVEGALAAGAVAAVLPKVFTGISALIGVTSQWSKLIGLLGIGLGGVVPAVLALGTAVAGLAIGAEIGSGGFAKFFETIQPAVEAVQDAFGQLQGALAPVFDALQGVGREIVATMVEGIRMLTPAVVELARELGPLAVIITKFLGSLVVSGIKLFVNALEELAKTLSFISGLITGLLEKLGLLSKTEITAKEEKESGKEPRRNVTPSGGRFENVQDTFFRVQAAASQAALGTKDPAERTASATEKLPDKMDTLIGKVSQLQPVVAR